MLEIIGLILGILGLFGFSTIVWFLKDGLVGFWYRWTGSTKNMQAAVNAIITSRSFPFPQRTNVGTYKEVWVQWFVDILSAVCNPTERHSLDRWFARWIQLSSVRPTRVAVPKLGNVILAQTVARRLNLPLLVVRQNPTQEIRPNYPFDGEVVKGDRVLLIDDVASDDEFLMRCVGRVRAANAEVVAVIVLVNRTEGACAERFTREGVPFYPLVNLSDNEIVELRA